MNWMTHKRRVIRLVTSLTDNAFTVGATFVVNVALARYATPTTYGVFILYYSIFTSLLSIHNGLVIEPLTVSAARTFSSNSHYSPRHLLLIQAIASAGIMLVAILCQLVSSATPYMLPWSVTIFATLALVAATSAALFRRYNYIVRGPAPALMSSFLSFVLICLLVALLSWVNALNAASAFVVLAAGSCLGSLVLFPREVGIPASRSQTELPKRDWDEFREHWRYARWSITSALIFLVTNQGYYWILAHKLSVAEVADFRAAMNLVLPAELITLSISMLRFPAIAAAASTPDPTKSRRLILTTTSMTMGITSVYACALWFLGSQAAHLLYGQKYGHLGDLISVLAVTPMINAISGPLNDTLKAYRKPNIISYGYIISGLMTAIIGSFCVATWGVWGASIGLVLSLGGFLVTLSIGLLVLHRHYRAPIYLALRE